MYGRYGNDDLNKFLLYVSIGLVILNLFIRVRALHVLIILLLIVIFARAWSRYFDKRQQENMKFLEIKNKIFGGRGFGKKNKNGNSIKQLPTGNSIDDSDGRNSEEGTK